MPSAVEGNAGDRERLISLDDQFAPGVIAERAAFQPDRPDLRAVRHGVVETSVVHGERIDAPLRLGEAPGGGIVGVKFRTEDVQAPAIVGHLVQTLGATTGDAVVELAEIGGVVVEAEAVDEAGVEIGGKEAVARRVVSQPADAGAAVLVAGKRRVGDVGHGARSAVDLVDGAGAAAGERAELSLHEACVGRTGLEADRLAVRGAGRRRRR